MTVLFEAVNLFFKAANDVLDVVLPWVLLAGLLAYPVIYFINGYKKLGKEKQEEQKKLKKQDLYSGTLTLFVVCILVFLLFWGLPEIIEKKLGWHWLTIILRWAIFISLFFFLVYKFGHENGEKRWLYSAIGHIGALLLGWIVQKWMGILFISLPIFAAYYFSLYSLATIIIPANSPEDRTEKFNRFKALMSYTWGIQRPMIVVGDHAWKKPEIRIPGDITYDFPVPGLIWMRSHQVTGVTGGVKFKRVDGPGLVFTGKLERPLQVMDLRLQLRTSEIDVLSKDGISFKARVFTGFRLDPDNWDPELYEKLRILNPGLRGADRLSYTQGSFPFSHLRVQAAISTTSTKTAGENPSVYWDQWTLSIVEREARKIISQKNLDELWRPVKDKKGANALEKIAEELKENSFLTLRAAGILVVVARVVNFRFPDEDEKQLGGISDQQIKTWGSERSRMRNEILATAQAESDRAQQEARAYAESILLNSIAEGLQRTGEIHPDLPRYVIAMRFLSSLQNYIHTQPFRDEKGSTDNEVIKKLQTDFKAWQERFFPNEK